MTEIESQETVALQTALLNLAILVKIPLLPSLISALIPMSMLAVMVSLNKIIMKLVTMETQTQEMVVVLNVLSKLTTDVLLRVILSVPAFPSQFVVII